MKLNLKDYVQRIQLISSEQADQTIKELDQTAWKDFDYKGSENICVQDNPSLPYQVTDADFPNLSDTVSKAVDNYINNFLKDLPWFSYWNGKTRFFWIKYPAGSDGMGVHADHVRNIFDGTRRGIPTLTVLGALNDNYEGGELEFWEDEQIKLKAGEALIFPSNFLYPHQVLPITKGNRYSFAVWIW